MNHMPLNGQALLGSAESALRHNVSPARVLSAALNQDPEAVDNPEQDKSVKQKVRDRTQGFGGQRPQQDPFVQSITRYINR